MSCSPACLVLQDQASGGAPSQPSLSAAGFRRRPALQAVSSILVPCGHPGAEHQLYLSIQERRAHTQGPCSQGWCAPCRVEALHVPLCFKALGNVLRRHLGETRSLQGTAAHVFAHKCAHAMWHWPSIAWVICSELCAVCSSGHKACRHSYCASGCCSACRVKAAHVPTRNRVLDDVLNREETRMPAEDLIVRRVRWQQWQAKEKAITQGMERALNLQQSLGSPAGQRERCLCGGLGSLCRLGCRAARRQSPAWLP